MIELGAGFNQELTARENIVLYGTLLGRDAGHMRDQVDPICEWAGLTEFFDSLIRTFSWEMLDSGLVWFMLPPQCELRRMPLVGSCVRGVG